MVDLKRRNLLKALAASSAMGALGLGTSPLLAAGEKSPFKWDKAPCRFCGTGCGVMIGVKDGKIAAVKADTLNPVNKGINCIKGYFVSKIMYGDDRIKEPLMRMDDKGNFSKHGKFAPITWERAFDEMEKQFKKYYNELGPTGVGIFGSGQYTIQEGYAAVKLMKAGFRSNTIDPNARHCMASAVVGFMQSFGIDEPAGCYDDIEATDTVITWGSNMAEMHPVLWSRVSDRKMASPKSVTLVNLTTYTNRTSDIADMEIVFRPQTDLAIFNYIAREILYNHPEAIDKEFLDNYISFATGFTNIGYGLRNNPNEKNTSKKEMAIVKKQKRFKVSKNEGITLAYLGLKEGDVVDNNPKKAGAHWGITLSEMKEALACYTLDFVADLAKGDKDESLESFKEKLQKLAALYISPRKVVSFWTMGFNQHQRGTWVNEQAYLIHMLLGKQCQPGNGAFSLTGQPSACGTAREVGTFTHRLPADMVVKNPAHIKIAEDIWHLPKGTLNTRPHHAFLGMMRDLEDGTLRFAWTQVTNPFANTANGTHFIKAARDMDNFIVVSDSYVGISARVADLILPTAMIYEKWGAYGNAERRTQHWKQQVLPVGIAMSDTWQMYEFAKRFTLKDVWDRAWPKLGLKPVLADALAMGYEPTTTLYELLFDNERARGFKVDAMYKGDINTEVFGDARHVIGSDGKEFTGYKSFIQKYLWEEYRLFGTGRGHDLAPFEIYHKVRGLRWPVVYEDGAWRETRWRFNAKYDPYAKKWGEGKAFAFYGNRKKSIQLGSLKAPNPKGEKKSIKNKAKLFFRPYMDPCEMPDEKYPFYLCTGRVIEHWHSGTMTMRVPELHSAMPNAFCYMNKADVAELGLKDRDLVVIESRRGKVKARIDSEGRNRPPRGLVFVPWFDESVFINAVTLDATCPLSKQTDYKKCAVKIYKA